MKNSDNRQFVYKRVLKQIKITSENIESFSNDSNTIEWVLADNLSFQRPAIICDNFKMINDSIKINDVFNKPLTNEPIPLREKLDEIIEIRNHIVHSGILGFTITTAEIINVLVEGVIGSYETICQFYSLAPEYNGLDMFSVKKDKSHLDNN